MVTCEEGWMAASFGGSIHDNIASRCTEARREGVVQVWWSPGKDGAITEGKKAGVRLCHGTKPE